MDNPEALYLGLLCAGVIFVSFLVLRWVWAPREYVPETPRLAEPPLYPGAENDTPLGPVTPLVAGLVPMSPDSRANLYRDLRNAGYYRPTGLMNFRRVGICMPCSPSF